MLTLSDFLSWTPTPPPPLLFLSQEVQILFLEIDLEQWAAEDSPPLLNVAPNVWTRFLEVGFSYSINKLGCKLVRQPTLSLFRASFDESHLASNTYFLSYQTSIIAATFLFHTVMHSSLEVLAMKVTPFQLNVELQPAETQREPKEDPSFVHCLVSGQAQDSC